MRHQPHSLYFNSNPLAFQSQHRTPPHLRIYHPSPMNRFTTALFIVLAWSTLVFCTVIPTNTRTETQCFPSLDLAGGGCDTIRTPGSVCKVTSCGGFSAKCVCTLPPPSPAPSLRPYQSPEPFVVLPLFSRCDPLSRKRRCNTRTRCRKLLFAGYFCF